MARNQRFDHADIETNLKQPADEVLPDFTHLRGMSVKKTLITGATDGIGLETARTLAADGHHLLLHGRSAAKLEAASKEIAALTGAGPVETFLGDLSDLQATANLARDIVAKHDQLDVLINNAGVLVTSQPLTRDGQDVRFVVNTIAPYLLTKRLLPLMGEDGRVVNLSSAAQAPVSISALLGKSRLSANAAYAQSKLAITMWTRVLAKDNPDGPVFVAVNPASLLGSKMVKEGYGIAGGDLRIGADILVRAALSETFATASGKYFDNDTQRFVLPHAAANDAKTTKELMDVLNGVVEAIR